MDAFVLAPPAGLPTGLSSVPVDGVKGLKAAVLYYPWCNDKIMGYELVKAVENDWSVSIQVYMIFISSLASLKMKPN